MPETLFGRAEPVKYLDGKYELRGEPDDDLAAAREWISMFMHQVSIRGFPEGKAGKCG